MSREPITNNATGRQEQHLAATTKGETMTTKTNPSQRDQAYIALYSLSNLERRKLKKFIKVKGRNWRSEMVKRWEKPNPMPYYIRFRNVLGPTLIRHIEGDLILLDETYQCNGHNSELEAVADLLDGCKLGYTTVGPPALTREDELGMASAMKVLETGEKLDEAITRLEQLRQNIRKATGTA